jgi:type II secretory pathway pseudopilin PulG
MQNAKRKVQNEEPRRFSLRSAFCILHSAFSPAYTLVELFLTLAVLMIVLGMMINLSNRVRKQSAEKVTREMLSRLTVLMAQYQNQYGQLPPITPLLAGDSARPDEASLLASALQNSNDYCRYLHLQPRASGGDDPIASALHSSPSSPVTGNRLPDDAIPHDTAPHDMVPHDTAPHDMVPHDMVLEDAWGSPIVFMAHQHPAVGMAPGDHFFFFSAGQDRKYLTREDNLYSYEETTLIRNAE